MATFHTFPTWPLNMAWGSSPPTCDPTGSLAEDVFLLEPRGHTKEIQRKFDQKNTMDFAGCAFKFRSSTLKRLGCLFFFFEKKTSWNMPVRFCGKGKGLSSWWKRSPPFSPTWMYAPTTVKQQTLRDSGDLKNDNSLKPMIKNNKHDWLSFWFWDFCSAMVYSIH